MYHNIILKLCDYVIITYVTLAEIYLKIWNLRVQKNLNIEKISFKFVQMQFLENAYY